MFCHCLIIVLIAPCHCLSRFVQFFLLSCLACQFLVNVYYVIILLQQRLQKKRHKHDEHMIHMTNNDKMEFPWSRGSKKPRLFCHRVMVVLTFLFLSSVVLFSFIFLLVSNYLGRQLFFSSFLCFCSLFFVLGVSLESGVIFVSFWNLASFRKMTRMTLK